MVTARALGVKSLDEVTDSPNGRQTLKPRTRFRAVRRGDLRGSP
jgi:hypothetical protein